MEHHTSVINIPSSAPGYQSQGRTPNIFVLVLWYQGCQAKPDMIKLWMGWPFTALTVWCWSLRLVSLPESGWRVNYLRVSPLLPENDPEPTLMESEMLEDRCMSEDHCFTPLSRTKEHLFNLKPEKYWVGQKVHSFISPLPPSCCKLALVAFHCL